MHGDTTGDRSTASDDAARGFDVGGYLARARRMADLSQRELAGLAGVHQSALARWESGARAVTVETLARVLDVVGLRLEVVDQDGRSVLPFDPDTVRDNAGRRFPAHLDVLPPDQRPANRGRGARYDRPAARGWYALRTTRDEPGAGGDRPPSRAPDHPTEAELSARREQRLQERLRQARERVARRPPPPPCTCLDDCYEHPACPPACPCQCEPRTPTRRV